jgi:hypothetical protein
MYHWVIDKVSDPEDQRFVGVSGPRGSSVPYNPPKGSPSKFRLLDDDRNVMAEGRFWGDASSEDCFGPLDDFGRGNWGCTIIQYWDKGWKDT